MLKKTLINNAFAFAMYIMTLGLMFILSFVLLFFPLFIEAQVGLVIGILLYIMCGFFLIPVEKTTYLSVVSVFVIIAAVLAVVYWLAEPGASHYLWMAYFMFNPIARSLLEVLVNPHVPSRLEPIITFLSPLYPAVLFYLGMLLRRLYIKLRKKRKNADEPPHEEAPHDET